MAIPRTETFGALAWWLAQARDHLRERWQEHIPPAVLIMVVNMVLALGLTMMLMVGFVLAVVVGEALDAEWLVLVAMLFVLPLSLGMGVLTQVVYGGYLRAVLHLEEERPLDVRQMVPTGRELGSLVVVFCLTMAAVLTGTIFCYLPGLMVGGLLICAPVLVLSQGLGPLAALKRSVQLTLQRPVDTMSLGVLKVVVAMGAAMVPGAGFILAVACLPFYAVLDVRLTASLLDLEQVGRGPGGGD